MIANPLIAPELHDIAASFRWNAEHALGDSSPLYQRLALSVSEDPAMLALAAHAQPHQPPMNLLFGAVHYLLLKGTDDRLRNFFPDLTRNPNTQDDPYPIFRAFCLERANELGVLIASRRVQTNEVARCALFLPAFEWVARRVRYRPFALLEVGASAGLNLNWDHYAYAYGDDVLCGEADAPVLLTCEQRGALRPRLPHSFPRTYSRAGIDLHPNDVFDDDAMLWLRALVWPEQLRRAERLQHAIDVAREFPPRVLRGDAVHKVTEWAQEIPRGVPIVFFHSFVLNQVDAGARERYYAQLRALDAEREWFDLAIEPQEWPAQLSVTTRHGQTVLAVCDHHGRWMEWTNNDDSV